jgi:AcrR family transcriptional regulator
MVNSLGRRLNVHTVNLPYEVHGVNILFVTPSRTPRAQPYHHGDLRRALVSAGTDLAREGGPGAIVLREAARRVGVSPNAAYRHFSSLPEMVAAVAFEALSALARSMEAELAQCVPSVDPAQAAIDRLGAVGRGYVHFALAEPGLFATAFTSPSVNEGGQSDGEPRGVGDSGLGPGGLLAQALDGMLAVGVLEASDREAAATNAWASVHGLSELLLGPLAGFSAAEQEAIIEGSLDLVCRGLLTRG